MAYDDDRKLREKEALTASPSSSQYYKLQQLREKVVAQKQESAATQKKKKQDLQKLKRTIELADTTSKPTQEREEQTVSAQDQPEDATRNAEKENARLQQREAAEKEGGQAEQHTQDPG